MILTTSAPRSLRAPFAAVIALTYAVLCVALLRDYVQLQSAAFWTGLLCCIVLAQTPATGPRSARFGWVALVFSLLYFLLPVGAARYLAFGAAGLCVLEQQSGRRSFLLPLSLLIMSPLFANLSGVIAFPLRLELTRIAGAALQFLGSDVSASGNVIRNGGADFSVDPACMGLHMLQCAVLCGIMMTTIFCERVGKRLPALIVAIVLLLCLGLNLGSNLLRIVLLVQFRIPPETAMHELMGVLCLVGYVLLPAAFLIRWLIRRFGRPEPAPLAVGSVSNGWALHAAIILSLIAGVALNPPKWDRTGGALCVPGYRITRPDAGILRMSRGSAVIYLKDLQGFYGSEHHPMLCWTGAGYRFRDVREATLNGLPVMRGILEHDGRQYSTAWWYSAGAGHNYSGPGWRWDALQNRRGYSIVNVTAPNDAALELEMRELTAAAELECWLRREGR